MASEKAKQLAAEQKAAAKAEKLRKKNSDDPRDWGRVKQVVEAYQRTAEVDPAVLGSGLIARTGRWRRGLWRTGRPSDSDRSGWRPGASLSSVQT